MGVLSYLVILLSVDLSDVPPVGARPSSSPIPVHAHYAHDFLSCRCHRRKTLPSQVVTAQHRLVSAGCSREAVTGERRSVVRNQLLRSLPPPPPSMVAAHPRPLLLKVTACVCAGMRLTTSIGVAMVGRWKVTAGHHLRGMTSSGSTLGCSVWRRQGTAARAAYMASLPLVCWSVGD
jgi:hypothetical protein